MSTVALGRSVHTHLIDCDCSTLTGYTIPALTLDVPSMKQRPLIVLDVSCGACHTLCVATSAVPGTNVAESSTVDTYVYSWGDGSRGKLGQGDERDVLVPTEVAGFSSNPALHAVKVSCEFQLM